ncbi:leucine rich repeat protein, BspA family protein [Entamoeba nuttalli P19]|uniref:Leucine rich repeat protein, BspA family protein n=1 Tax=Entamoeba nuttalli (strain P19) TaxID=1076696 RepID=K2H3H4_ENTNP|nr:leucine rich repeat protein, BspA family protein [Entamoeba nuttalli P19]EKE42028.1 leucine rich repeat protein, BspA family protein [Entamoeba nuttalli P19]|eukprot:XP_008855640.1 leucine rich repeat protein, BspA family protein [Entamoeba nuttalli P19]
MTTLDIYSLQIVTQYLTSKYDFINIIQTTKKYMFILDRFRVNPIRITSFVKNLFHFLDTQIVYYETDYIMQRVVRLIIQYPVSYSNIASITKQYKDVTCIFKNIVLDSFNGCDKKIIPKEVSILGDCCFEGERIKAIIIPNTIKEIRTSCFSECGLRNIKIPNSVTQIKSFAFSNCRSLTKVELPSFLNSIENDVFKGCVKLKEIDIPNSISSLGNGCFSESGIRMFEITSQFQFIDENIFCMSLLRKISFTGVKKIPNGICSGCFHLTSVIMDDVVECIFDCAFEQCIELKNINFSSNLKFIGNSAFFGCAFNKIILPKNLEFIGDLCFSNCKNLTELRVLSKQCIIGDRVFFSDIKLKILELPLKDGKYPFPVTKEEKKILKRSGIECINILIDQEYVEPIELLNTNKQIRNIQEFGESMSTSICILNSAYRIDGNLLSSCYCEEMIFPKGIIKIDDGYIPSPNLTKIVLPECIEVLHQEQIAYLKGLKVIEIPTSVTRIEKWCFNALDKLESLQIPSSVKILKNEFIIDCSSLTELNWNNKEPIMKEPFNYLIYTQLKKSNIHFTKFTLNGLDGIDPLHFTITEPIVFQQDDFNEQISKFTILPNNLIEINGSNRINETLTSITIPSSVTSIGKSAFVDFINLKEIYLPENEIEFDDCMFKGCTSLSVIKSKNPKNLQINFHSEIINILKDFEYNFQYNKRVIKNYHPSNYYEENYSIQNFCLTNVQSIDNEAFFYFTTITHISFSTELISIGDTAFRQCSMLKTIQIPSTVTFIGEACFERCSSLSSIKIENPFVDCGNYCFNHCVGLTSIPLIYKLSVGIFEYCESLQYISLLDGVKELSSGCFSHCISLKDISIPHSVTTIRSYCFSECFSLTSIDIPAEIKLIEFGAFYDCKNLRKVIMKNEHIELGDHLFDGCASLNIISINGSRVKSIYTETSYSQYKYFHSKGINCKRVSLSRRERIENGLIAVMNKNIVRIDECCFGGCIEFTKLTVPSNITEIGSFCFKDCLNLQSIVLPSSITSIPPYCFDNCTSLTSIEIPSTIKKFGDKCFSGCVLLKNDKIPNECFKTVNIEGVEENNNSQYNSEEDWIEEDEHEKDEHEEDEHEEDEHEEDILDDELF